MLTGNIILFGDTANKTRFLRDETDIFERYIDIFMAGGVVGILLNKKGEEKHDDNNVKIFAEQLNLESTRIKYLSSLAFLVENFDSEHDEKELLRKTFGDWFAYTKVEYTSKTDDKDNKYYLFKLYAIEGINILYEVIVGDSTDRSSYTRNFFKFIQELEKLQVNDSLDRTIVGALFS